MLAQQLIIQLSHYKRTIRSARTGDSFLLQTKKREEQTLKRRRRRRKTVFFFMRGEILPALFELGVCV